MKTYDFYRKRSRISTVITISTLLVGGGMLACSVLSTDVRPIVPDAIFYTAISLCLIGFISFFMGMNYDQKWNTELNKIVEKRRAEDFDHIIELISQKRSDDAIKALKEWVQRYKPVNKI